MNSGNNKPEFIVVSKSQLIKAAGGDMLYAKINELENVIEVDEKVFSFLSDTETPQGVLVVLEKPSLTYEHMVNNISGKYLVLDKIADAGNLGTIIRNCVSFGVSNLVCIKGTVDAYSPKVVRSTMGAISKLNIYYVSVKEFSHFVDILKDNGYEFVSTELSAKEYLSETEPTNKTIYILGNESNGVGSEIRCFCSRFVKIPMEDIQESLNVAVASSIVLYDQYYRNKQ